MERRFMTDKSQSGSASSDPNAISETIDASNVPLESEDEPGSSDIPQSSRSDGLITRVEPPPKLDDLEGLVSGDVVQNELTCEQSSGLQATSTTVGDSSWIAGRYRVLKQLGRGGMGEV